MSLVAQLAGARVTMLPRIGGFQHVAAIGGGCHAGAGHGVALARGAAGHLCAACWDAYNLLIDRLMGRTHA